MKKGLILGLIAAMVPSVALAQNLAPGQAPDPVPVEVTTPTLPDNAVHPTDYQGSTTTSGGTSGGATSGTTTSGPVTGYSGGDLMITDINPALYGGG